MHQNLSWSVNGLNPDRGNGEAGLLFESQRVGLARLCDRAAAKILSRFLKLICPIPGKESWIGIDRPQAIFMKTGVVLASNFSVRVLI